MRIPAIVAALLLASCAQYHPLPLATDPVALSPPVAHVLEQQAGAIDRPWLKPVTLDLSAPLTPDALATLTVLNNPDLKALRVRAGVADAQVFAAGLLPDPTLSFGASKVVAGDDQLFDVVGALGLDLTTLRTRGVLRAQARASARQVRLDLAWAEWQAAGQARIQGVRILALKNVLAIAQRSADATQSLFAHTQAAAGRGDVSGDRLETTRKTAHDAQTQKHGVQNDLATAKGQLAALLGLPPGTELRLAETPLPESPPPADALLALASRNRADLQALQAGYAAEEAAVHKAVLDQFPALGLTFNGERDSGGNLLLGPAINFTLPLWNRNRGGIAVEQATRAALNAEYEARLFQTRADIVSAEQGIVLATRQLADAREGLPRLQAYAEGARRAAARGDLSEETATAAEQALRDRLTQIAQAEQAIREQTIALELLTGTPREAWTQ